MGLLDFLRKPKRVVRELPRSELEEKWEESSKVDGIFDVLEKNMVQPYYDRKRIISAQGTVLSFKRGQTGSERELHVIIKNERGEGKIEFPYDVEFPRNLEYIEKLAVGSKVKYTHENSVHDDGQSFSYLNIDTFSLDFLDGPLQGEKLERKKY